MAEFIHDIATVVPEHYFKQDFLREKMKEYIGEDRITKSIIHRLYANSGIDKRHAVINDFNENGHPRFFFQKDGTLSTPTTGKRNSVYSKFAKKLYVDIADKLLEQSNTFSKKDITHIITVSCTGFFAPEPAYEIVKQLGLSPSTRRFHLGFMGCFAAFPALKMARSFCRSHKDATVMVVCLELCSLHFQDSEKTDNLISGSVFADGGAGVLVSNKKPSPPYFQLNQFATSIAKESEDDMAWTIGDTGFEMVLSTGIPEIIEENLQTSIQPLIKQYDMDINEISHWAVHPGGRAILDTIQQSLSLDDQQLNSSRSVLSDFGNMSSATILFVLRDLLEEESAQQEENIFAMAFGPGLTIESTLLTKTSR